VRFAEQRSLDFQGNGGVSHPGKHLRVSSNQEAPMQNVLITGGAGFIGWRDVINGVHKAWIDKNCSLRIAI
jgi:hypothetical protein